MSSYSHTSTGTGAVTGSKFISKFSHSNRNSHQNDSSLAQLLAGNTDSNHLYSTSHVHNSNQNYSSSVPRSIFHPDYSPSPSPRPSFDESANSTIRNGFSSPLADAILNHSVGNSNLINSLRNDTKQYSALELDELFNSDADQLHSASILAGPTSLAHFLYSSLNILNSLRFINPFSDQFNTIGRPKYLRALYENYYRLNQRIEFVLPAFPFKSPNTQYKVLGHLPDRGEELSLKTLENFVKQFSEFYEPGAKLIIMSDGRVFSDLLGVSDQRVREYETALKQYLSDWVAWDSLDRHIGPTEAEWKIALEQKNKENSTAADSPTVEYSKGDFIRDKLVSLWETSEALDRLHREIREDSDLARVYRGFSQFLQLDLQWPNDWSKSRIKKKSFDIAGRMLVRNQSFSLLVEKIFPLAIRLSIHSHSNTGPKYGIKMIPSSNSEIILATPWHNCVVELASGEEILMKRVEAEKLGYKIVYKQTTNGELQPWMFKEEINKSNENNHGNSIVDNNNGVEHIPNQYTSNNNPTVRTSFVASFQFSPSAIIDDNNNTA